MSEPSPTSKRRGRLLRIGAAVAVLLALAGYLTVQYVTGGAAPGCKVVAAHGDASYEFTPEQAVNAATIAAVGTGRGMPERAVTIALATALQESGLRNLNHGDRDSLGLFQQRPSQGWGTPQEIMDPTYAAGMFYEHLAKVPDYTDLPLTVAAQRVQRSGFPEAYAKHEPDATLLADALTGHSAATLTCQGRPSATATAGPQAVRAALVRDFGRDVLQEAGAVVDDDGASPSPAAPHASAVDDRTVTLPVSAAPQDGRSARQRGWQLAHWAVANASALHIERVSYAGREWTAGLTDGEWHPVDAKNDDRPGTGADAGAVRITTGH
ncbi:MULTISPECIES: heavy metal transporter [Streptomyces]|uniref:Heavy metal transporter n=1 Tax=Streptomyces thermoviolaceus subsp. thermoviolaceus TaxID=66860 RepID=A0ABX0YRT5_STRTL|nr:MULTISPECIES: heavy metal transporter [Streptomyces]NJP15193.1 heavy metal transporter [Streptomyces thermoviolaceus subsp. thermoviolaceus]RSS07706.1 heavy metal transporter [Streptomyces sp. WAC00469]WTD47573.1 heavy metal transporter [Streptomyces thermoviolaceus]